MTPRHRRRPRARLPRLQRAGPYKIGQPTYLSNYKYYLIVASVEIGGGHGLPLVSNSLLEQFQNVVKAFKFWCGDNDILNNSTP